MLKPLRAAVDPTIDELNAQMDRLDFSRPLSVQRLMPPPAVEYKPRRLGSLNSLYPAVYPLGLGTIWFGRRWPPKNEEWTEPTQLEVNAHLHSSFMEVASNNPATAIIVATAEGYCSSQERLGRWLQGAGIGFADRAVICTKFGERHDADTNTTALDHSPYAAERAFRNGTREMGRIDVFYSHVTSQLSEEEATEALENESLSATLQRLRNESGCLLGCALSHEFLLERALPGRGKPTAHWLAILDVMQLPAIMCLRRPDLVLGLAELGIDVVANSPVRGMPLMEGIPGCENPSGVIRRLLATKGIKAVLSGSRTHMKETLTYCRDE